MKRVFIIHRWAGDPKGDWRSWLRRELEQQGFIVHAPEMPDKEVPVIEKWVGHLTEVVGEPDDETYFVGHSIGCQTIMRYLLTIDKPVGGAVFVAGWFDLKNLEYGEVGMIAKPWIETPIDPEKIKSVLPSSTLLISDNDPYEAFEFNKQKFSEIGSKIVEVHEGGHLTNVDGYNEFPLLLEEFNKLVK